MGNSQSDLNLDPNEVGLRHFKLLRVVGKGAFGKVRIVERKDSGLTFALKYVSKEEIVRQENVRNIVRERKMLEALNHPFLCNLRYSFQDHEFVYLVVDLMTGGDLRFHIDRKTFTEEAVRFWIAELGCALRYIHAQGIVHRDVKPDNVLLDSEGHVHLADFNVAAEFGESRRALSSKSGTLAYVAPEAMSGKHYKSEVDWWALGVLLYECIYGRRPFNRKKHGPEIEEQVIEANPKYPITEPPVEPMCVGAIKRLLTKDVANRMGANGFENFTQHPFFQPIDFEALESKQIRPIFRPSAEKANFDATYDLEELLLEDSPLEARAKYQRPRAALKPDATEADKRIETLYKMIETHFEPFDYQKAHYSRQSSVAQPNETLSSDSGTKSRSSLQRKRELTGANSAASSGQKQTSITLASTPSAAGSTLTGANSTTSSQPQNPSVPSAPQAPAPAQTRNVTRPSQGDRATPLRSELGGQHRSQSVSGFERRRSTRIVTSPAEIEAASQNPQGAANGAAGSGWADLTPRKPAKSADDTGVRSVKGKSGTSGGVFGFMGKRRSAARMLEARERGLLGKAGSRTVVAEDGG